MKSLLPHPTGSEVPNLSAVHRPAAVPTRPKVSARVVLADLRAADTSWAAPARRPAGPAPRVDHLAQLLVSRRTVRRLAAVYDDLATEVEAALAELAALAPLAMLKAGVAL